MQTFMQELEGLVSKVYLGEVLPKFRLMAPKVVAEGLGKIRVDAVSRALVDVQVEVGMSWVKKDHQLDFFRMVRALTPVDVEISLSLTCDSIQFGPGVYGKEGMGGKEYDFPCWGRQGLGRQGAIRHNLSYLKEKGITGTVVTLFEFILRMFNSLGDDGITEIPGDFNLSFAVEILDRVLTWGMSNSSKAVDMTPSEYRGLFACMVGDACNVEEMKSVDEARAKLFSPK